MSTHQPLGGVLEKEGVGNGRPDQVVGGEDVQLGEEQRYQHHRRQGHDQEAAYPEHQLLFLDHSEPRAGLLVQRPEGPGCVGEAGFEPATSSV